MVADMSTLNNARCSYDNTHFTRGGLTEFSPPSLAKEVSLFGSFLCPHLHENL